MFLGRTKIWTLFTPHLKPSGVSFGKLSPPTEIGRRDRCHNSAIERSVTIYHVNRCSGQSPMGF